jgi:hypothetical protein
MARSLQQSNFSYHDFLSPKAHLPLNELSDKNMNSAAASRLYYYLEVCWLAASTNLKIPPVRLKSGREKLADIIKGNNSHLHQENIKEHLHAAITCTDGIASRIGASEMRKAQLLLSQRIDMALYANNDNQVDRIINFIMTDLNFTLIYIKNSNTSSAKVEATNLESHNEYTGDASC